MEYYHIQVRVNSSIKPKDNFITSTIRGSYGHFLKAQTCIEPSYDCNTCEYTKVCLFAKLYNKNSSTNTPPPIRFDAKLYTTNYDFNIYLYQNNVLELRPILSTLQLMLQSKTIGNEKIAFPNSEIYLNNKKLSFDEKKHLKLFKPIPSTLCIGKYSKEVALAFLSPLYIKDNKTFIHANKLKLEDILLSIHRRKKSLEIKSQDTSKLDYTPSYTLIASDIKEFKEEKTHSSDQKRDIPLIGVIGKMVFTNLDEKSFELLKYGEVLGLGKNVAKGQGAIKLIY